MSLRFKVGQGRYLCILIAIGFAACRTGTEMRLHVQKKVKASKKIALVIPEARIYYTTRNSAVPNGDPFESFVDQGPVTHPQYAQLYANVKKGIEEGFGTKIDLYEPGRFKSQFVFSKRNTETEFHYTEKLPSELQETAGKYDMFIVLKPIERYDCYSYPKEKRYVCTAWIEASLNNFEKDDKDKSRIQKVNRDDDNSFLKYGHDDFFRAEIDNRNSLREEEVFKVTFKERALRVKPERLTKASEEAYVWARNFATNVMAEKAAAAK